MPAPLNFGPLQTRFFRQLQGLGLCTDDSLAAYLTSIGVNCDRTTIVRWRAGERAAPLGVLWSVLAHVDDPAAVLNIIAREFGLRVVPDQTASPGDLTESVLDVAERSGELVSAVRAARADGVVTPSEAAEIRKAAESLRQAAAELDASVAPRTVAAAK